MKHLEKETAVAKREAEQLRVKRIEEIIFSHTEEHPGVQRYSDIFMCLLILIFISGICVLFLGAVIGSLTQPAHCTETSYNNQVLHTCDYESIIPVVVVILVLFFTVLGFIVLLMILFSFSLYLLQRIFLPPGAAQAAIREAEAEDLEAK